MSANIQKIGLLFHTLRHVKVIQIYWRVYLKLLRFLPFSIAVNQVLATRKLKFQPTKFKYASFVDSHFVFLNKSHLVSFPMDWNTRTMDKLWLYNLHYFDYLNQAHIEPDQAVALMLDWIECNPVKKGTGWEPYPISLRIVNWIKFIAQAETLKSEQRAIIDHSLFLQARFLNRHLEFHLLGNHLFKNAVALLFAGVYFEGDEATRWRLKGLEILKAQLQEQVLADGGHFERSPMYHVLILEDILDCLNLQQAKEFLSNQEWAFVEQKARAMLDFLIDIVHQDGEIPFFNDSALKIAPETAQVIAYAKSLTIQPRSAQTKSDMVLVEKNDFGLFILDNNISRMILDAGIIGPDYLPGHAHCDTLSYELSIAGQRCIVNSGTYQYAGELRNHFRATQAHNTLKIDELEQHEIWSTFRVARRGYPKVINVARDTDSLSITAVFSGFDNRSQHERTVHCERQSWSIIDVVHGQGQHLAESFIHFHHDVELFMESPQSVLARIHGISFHVLAGNEAIFNLEEGWYAPEFGYKQKNQVLILRKQGPVPIVLSYQIKIV